MKAQTTKQPLVPLSLFSATESLAAAGAQATEPEQADTAPMAVDTGSGCRTPSMSNRFDAQGQSSSGDLDDEFLILMSLDGEMMTEAPVDPLCDAMRGHEAGQHRPAVTLRKRRTRVVVAGRSRGGPDRREGLEEGQRD